MPARQRFPPKRRLRKRREFLLVQGQGRRLNGRHFRFFVHHRGDSKTSSMAGEARFGITVTRKVGNAVTRNRIKRVVREGCRQVARLFPSGLDIVIVAHPSAATVSAAATAGELFDLARRLAPGSAR